MNNEVNNITNNTSPHNSSNSTNVQSQAISQNGRIIIHGNNFKDSPIKFYVGNTFIAKISSGSTFEYVVKEDSTLTFKFRLFQPAEVNVKVGESVEIFLSINYGLKGKIGAEKRYINYNQPLSQMSNVQPTQMLNNTVQPNISSMVNVKVDIVGSIIGMLFGVLIISFFLLFIVGGGGFLVFLVIGVPVAIFGGINNAVMNYEIQYNCQYCGKHRVVSIKDCIPSGDLKISKCPFCEKNNLIDVKNRQVFRNDL